METVHIQSVGKAVSPKAPSARVPPTDVAESQTMLDLAKSGKDIPPAKKSTQTKDEIEKTVSALNSFVQSIQRGIQFSLHEETGRSVITITDRETGEEIRKFPSDQVLAIAEHIAETRSIPDENLRGVLVNRRA